jgi:hypothetical protein
MQNVPSASSPPVPSSEAPSKLQQYMPLLLIANLFVMLVLLVVVVFVLARR